MKEEKIFDLIIIGGGPAGMMAAISAKTFNPKAEVCLLERNQSLGKKLSLTGKGRCNLTTTKKIPEIIEAFPQPEGKFLYGALNQFSNQDLIDFFEKRGVKLKEERGQRIFPESDNSETILEALKKEIKEKKVKTFFDFRAIKISRQAEIFTIYSTQGKKIKSLKLIVATGGKSYPATGSTGDGYKIGENLGHAILSPKPALVPLIVKDKKIRALSGLSLKNVSLAFYDDEGKFAEMFGEMLFTHVGISGPIVLTLSEKVFERLVEKKQKVKARIDLKPALTEIQIKRRIQREMEEIGKKEYVSLLMKLLPKSLVYLFSKLSGIDEHLKVGSLMKEEKEKIIQLLKNFEFEIDGVMPIERGIVTAGGIDTKEINPKTMESKIIPNLFWAGEVIGIHGQTGGFNLTQAFSTGWVAGSSASNL